MTGSAEARAQRARTFRLTAWGTLVIGVGSVLLLIFQQPGSQRARGGTIACLLVAIPVLLELNRRGRTTLASWCLILGLIALTTYRAFSVGGISTPVAPLYVIVVMMAGVLLGARSGVVSGILCVACGFGLVLAEEKGALPAPQFEMTGHGRLLYLALFMGLTLVLQSAVAASLRDSLARAMGELAERRRAEAERERVLHDLGERVKELSLLHAFVNLLRRSQSVDQDLLRELVGLLPAAWQHPECCQARIAYGQVEAATPGFCDSPWKQGVSFSTSHGPGAIEVVYTEERPEADEGPFLAEERATLRSLSEMLVSHIELRRHQRGLEDLVTVRTAELSESLERLQKLERLRDDLVHMVVHDMRTPLMVLTLRLDQARSRAPSGLEKSLDEAARTASTLNRMAETLLDVSRLEEGRMPLTNAPWDLTQLAAEVRDTMAAADPLQTIELQSPGPVVVTCDGALVRRVLENLVSNGIKHTPAGCQVRIEVRPLPGGARVTVQDEGAGVPPEARERIFEKFATVAAPGAQSYHSAGLGLAFCKLAIEAHGGTIGVDSARPTGSLFWIELPGPPQ